MQALKNKVRNGIGRHKYSLVSCCSGATNKGLKGVIRMRMIRNYPKLKRPPSEFRKSRSIVIANDNDSRYPILDVKLNL